MAHDMTPIDPLELTAAHVGEPILVQFDDTSSIYGVLSELRVELIAHSDSLEVRVDVALGPELVTFNLSRADVRAVRVPKPE